jgi:hypothetical protein
LAATHDQLLAGLRQCERVLAENDLTLRLRDETVARINACMAALDAAMAGDPSTASPELMAECWAIVAEAQRELGD